VNFGKSIKLKAQMMLQDTHAIKEQINGVKQPVMIEESLGMSKLKRAASFDDDDFSLKSKMVRFEDEESEQSSLQYSRNRRKNQSILKKSPSIDVVIK
jgi:hypothetical protein